MGRAIDADELKTAFPCGESVRTECVRATIDHMPTIEPEQKCDNFEKGLHDMFDHIWDCEINHPVFQDTVGDLMRAVIQLHNNTVEPNRKRGNWVGIDDEPCETFECNRCGFILEDWIQGVFYRFCPNCGATMT